MEQDPRAQRFRGIAHHGHTPFDVPYISPVAVNLYQGGCKTGLVLPSEIKHVVSLYPWERYTNKHQVDSYTEVRMYDSLDGPNWDQVEALADWINVCRMLAPTLVHCQAGLNRSGLLAAVALVRGGMVPSEAIDLLRSSRSPAVLCNPLFESLVMEYQT